MTDVRVEPGTGDDAEVRALGAIAQAVAALVRALEEYRDLRRGACGQYDERTASRTGPRGDARARSGTTVLRRSLPKLLGRVSALAVALLEEPADPPS